RWRVAPRAGGRRASPPGLWAAPLGGYGPAALLVRAGAPRDAGRTRARAPRRARGRPRVGRRPRRATGPLHPPSSRRLELGLLGRALERERRALAVRDRLEHRVE